MFITLAAALAVVGGAAHAFPSLPTFAARHGPALLTVHDDQGARLGQGFFVASDGTAVAVVDGHAVGAVVRARLDAGVDAPARIVRAEPPLVVLHVALPPDHLPMSLVVPKEARSVPEWVMAVFVDDDGARRAAIGGPHRGARTPLFDIPAPLGSPLVDERGTVVAVAVEARGQSRVLARAAPDVARLVALAGPSARGPPPPPHVGP